MSEELNEELKVEVIPDPLISPRLMRPVARLYLGRHPNVSLARGPGMALVTELSAKLRINALRAALEAVLRADSGRQAAAIANAALKEDERKA